ncbi:glycosyltransferase family 39 protein [Glaciibacter sp. 2TAF33]|uniref:glycosyltransferase family 39 protein n=1 Tax=Glaciibacter sp. 2TAF33 TaxID=3233015 RepID=UPI003F8E7D50
MTAVLAPPTAEAATPPRLPYRRGFGATAALLGLFGFVVSAAGSWQPSFWGDEAASVMSAERTLPSLFRMLGHIDAVHGTYYLFLHYWIGLFGTSEFSTRLPSALAVGLATAGVAVLARSLVNTRVAIIAALVFAVLPRVTYMGAEARSTALATAIVAWATVLLVHILRRQQETGRVAFWLWAGYALVTASGAYMFLYTILLVPVHALAVLLVHRASPVRNALVPWLTATVAAVLLAAPVVYWGVHEQQQISFIGRRPQVSPLTAAVDQWFGNPALAAVAWLLVVLGAVTVFATRRGTLPGGRSIRPAVLVALAWMLIPTTVLLVGTRLVTPMYSLRYLSICTPAAALMIAIGIASVRLRWVQVTAVLVVVGLAAPTYLIQRGQYGKDGGSDWRQVAAIVQAGAHPGDAVVFDEGVRPSRKTRLALHLYPDSFQGVRDITLDRPYAETDWLWDTTIPLNRATPQLANTGTVWLLQNRGSRDNTSGTSLRTLEQAGFSVAHSTPVDRTVVIEMTR